MSHFKLRHEASRYFSAASKKINQQYLCLLKIREPVKFITVGAFTAGVDIGLFWTFLNIFNLSILLAASLSFIVSFGINFLGHAKITFLNKASLSSLIKFSILVLLNYLITVGVITTGVQIFETPIFWKVLAVLIISLNGFLLGKKWVFSDG